MDLRTLKNEELGLLLMGLDAIFVADQEPVRVQLMKSIRDELAVRGVRVKVWGEL